MKTIFHTKLARIFFFTFLISTSFFYLSKPACTWAKPSQEARAAKIAGDDYLRQGDIQKGIEAYERALKVYPQYAEVYYLLGLIYDQDLKNPQKGIVYYQKFLELAPDSPDAETVRFLMVNARQAVQPDKSSHPDGSDLSAASASPKAGSLPPLPEAEKRVLRGNNEITRLVEDNVLKYDLKIKVWEREGYIGKFNDLALARGSSLTNNIPEKRAQLRQERQKLTEFINYPREAEYFILRRAVNDFIKEQWDISLLQLPQGIDMRKAVLSSRVLDMQEDKKYVRLSLEVKIDKENIKNQLLGLGYQFTPMKIQLQCSNLYGEFNDRFIDAVCRKSKYIKSQSKGLYEIYTTLENFVAELSNMTIGQYAIHIDDITPNKVAFTAEIHAQ